MLVRQPASAAAVPTIGTTPAPTIMSDEEGSLLAFDREIENPNADGNPNITIYTAG